MAGETAKRVGERIRDRRLELGLKQRGLADRIPNDAVNNQRVSDWERGVHQPSERHLMQLATALEVDVAYFYAAPDTPPPPPDLIGTFNGTDRIGRLEALVVELNAKVDELLELMRDR